MFGGTGPPVRRADMAIATFLCILFAACGGDADRGSGYALDRGLGAEPESLDYHKARSSQAGDVQRDLGEGLTGYTPEGELVPRAALRWEVSDDGLEYRFWLRPDARWSTGEPVTAEDFVYSFRRLVAPATASFYSQSIIDVRNAEAILAGEKAVEELAATAEGEFLLHLGLARPAPYFLALLTHPSMFPVHRASVERHGDGFARPGNLVTNGAYRLVEWELGSLIELQRNENYWDNASTAIDRVRHHFVAEPAVELNRYRAGELHITSTVPPEAFARMRETRPEELRVAPYLNVYYYGFNLTKPPFKDNPELRRALSMAIDREALTESVTGRGETPAWSWVPPGVDNYSERRFPYSTMSDEEREAAAKRAYRSAGYGDGEPIEIEIRYNTSDTHQRIALAIQSMWRDVLGVEATLVNEEFQVLLSNMRAKEVTQVFRSSWLGDYNDANTFLQVMLSDAPSNLTGYANPDFDALVAQAAAQTDPEERRRYMQEAESLLLADHPVIPIYFFVSKHLVSPRIGGWGDNVLDYHYSQHLSLLPE
ncbi:MAG TPA: peptide ABC transporter substrate-binding protein, partial [Woeseiaceae bacterium]|nr:peptide ABC transporter substrate-binding protein [Woeseiaceae bacterium]